MTELRQGNLKQENTMQANSLNKNVLQGALRELTHQTQEPACDAERPQRQVSYAITTDSESASLVNALGKEIRMTFAGVRTCVHCGRKVGKLYQNGYCFPCVTTLAECDLCIVKPHECHYHLGTCRDSAFGDTHCMIPHYVYLADSSNVKVGLTRKGRQLTRWVDQGATSAMLLAEVPTRKIAGELEMEVAKHLADKTDWRKMLRDTGDHDADLIAVKKQVQRDLDESFKDYILTEDTPVYRFSYPRLPDIELTLKSISLDKQPILTGTLLGIKGQYLILDIGVFNVRKHTGYHVEAEIG